MNLLKVATEGTPLMRYYSSFAKAKEEETRRIVAKTEEISEGYDFIPKLDKKKEKAKKKGEAKEFKGILGDDSSDSEMVREVDNIRRISDLMSFSFFRTTTRGSSSERRGRGRRGRTPQTREPRMGREQRGTRVMNRRTRMNLKKETPAPKTRKEMGLRMAKMTTAPMTMTTTWTTKWKI